ncbi:hypothetical protein FUT69_00500 [Xylella taiwanensis]|uniref:Uncharacterized protein n=1 Tax=Xylella taiwanensis TaxID=1444770 RepID=Z9JIE4_9GAMM|nr:hypothetical protein [Xylella taiwanensis]EWS77949.1 hypothetical protein AF72_08035 [Xylella taiwanensis]MCD8456215.1 hypothetical protein [Xylella taiwanensis]MCD8458623.1 hypothetical protein [Xylella taiwanensis]MCD8460758.1 hypothetical protein [Xylella taiwanensis]MCD8463183.1 hypothetical protein [Xylella taiwanensis]
MNFRLDKRLVPLLHASEPSVLETLMIQLARALQQGEHPPGDGQRGDAVGVEDLADRRHISLSRRVVMVEHDAGIVDECDPCRRTHHRHASPSAITMAWTALP